MPLAAFGFRTRKQGCSAADVPEKDGPVPECAIFFQHHSRHRFPALGGAVIDPRRGTEATTPCPVREYGKIGAFSVFCLVLPVFSPFSGRKSRKYGLLRGKVPMFYPKSTDVSAREVRSFTLSVAQFFCLLPRFLMI